VFIGAGRADPIAPAAQAERLAELLRQAGADVTLHWQPGGHTITKDELEAARRWIAHCLTARAGQQPPAATARVHDDAQLGSAT
jgi:predicted esterase